MLCYSVDFGNVPEHSTIIIARLSRSIVISYYFLLTTSKFYIGRKMHFENLDLIIVSFISMHSIVDCIIINACTIQDLAIFPELVVDNIFNYICLEYVCF